jgi:hypothetical protein
MLDCELIWGRSHGGKAGLGGEFEWQKHGL